MEKGQVCKFVEPSLPQNCKNLINHDDNDDNSSDGNDCMRPRSPRSQYLLGLDHASSPDPDSDPPVCPLC